MPPSSRRLFIGLALPAEIGTRLVRQVRPLLAGADGELPRGIRVLAEDDLHLTLLFLGSFPEERRPTFERALVEELRGLNAPELALTGTGGFPSLAQARVLWAGVEERSDAGRLDALVNRSRQAATLFGWRPSERERRQAFRPHVTLARVGRAAGGDEPRIDRAFERLSFEHRWLPVEVALYESRPDRPQERYRALRAIPLVVRPG